MELLYKISSVSRKEEPLSDSQEVVFAVYFL